MLERDSPMRRESPRKASAKPRFSRGFCFCRLRCPYNSFDVFRSVLNDEYCVRTVKRQQICHSIFDDRFHPYITLFPHNYFCRDGNRLVIYGFDRQLHLRARHVCPCHSAVSFWQLNISDSNTRRQQEHLRTFGGKQRQGTYCQKNPKTENTLHKISFRNFAENAIWKKSQIRLIRLSRT